MPKRNSRYLELLFPGTRGESAEILIASLSEQGFEGFEEGTDFVKAYIPVDEYKEASVKTIARKLDLVYSTMLIEEKNWNEAWESDYHPVIIEGIQGKPWVSIRADFHQPQTIATHELVITPKMSFGTGHHPTTLMMVQQMEEIDFRKKTVLDFGTGTGVLAILAEKLGADSILAIDNDEWSIENSAENIQRNSCTKISLRNNGIDSADPSFDIILANINKNVILPGLPLLVSHLRPPGILVLSGLLEDDLEELLKAGRKLTLKPGRLIKRNPWISIRLDC